MKFVARLAGAIACVALAGILGRGGIADAILARGDDAAGGGRLAAAASYYDRARAFGGDSLAAVERYALLALLLPRGAVSTSALRSANAFLKINTRSARGYFDRGLIEWRSRDYAAAAHDFRTASAIGHDSRAVAFARAAVRRARLRTTP